MKNDINITDEELYSVTVYNQEDRKKHDSCRLDQHGLFLFIEDVSEKYTGAAENSVYYECVCLDCGKHADFKMSINDRTRVVCTNKDPVDALLSFYDIRKKYLQLKQQSLSNEQIAQQLNEFYKNQNPAIVKKITRNNFVVNV